MMLIRLLSVKSGMMLDRCVNALLKGWDNENWSHTSKYNIQITSTPGEYVLAGIWVDHGAKLGDHDAVGLGVPPEGVTLQELAPVGHLT